ncbi:MAG: M55 family metallopeptidase [Clostridia bacterium]|nr:M55 family metallopeptidase [Clostridia bacterium]
MERKRILLALDLEGVNLVVGEPYKGLGKGSEQWEIARRQGAKEINTAANALFAAGAEVVALWDNHGGGNNVDPADLDPRIDLLQCDLTKPRQYFSENYDCICYFGYHAMEGTLGGVLAHTMSSKDLQFYKWNGKYIGEVDMDAAIAASYGLHSCCYVGGNIACAQAERAVPGIVTVVTKKELSRNRAEFRDNEELFAEIAEKIVEAVGKELPLAEVTFPGEMQKSFKRVEDAAVYLERLQNLGIKADYLADDILGRDAHTVVATVGNMDEYIKCI